jgi:hypothetical protein
MNRGPNPGFDIAPGSLDRVQLIFFRRRLAIWSRRVYQATETLFSLPAIPKPQLGGARPRRRSKYEKIFQLAALHLLARCREHRLSQFRFAPPFLNHAYLPACKLAKWSGRSPTERPDRCVSHCD